MKERICTRGLLKERIYTRGLLKERVYPRPCLEWIHGAKKLSLEHINTTSCKLFGALKHLCSACQARKSTLLLSAGPKCSLPLQSVLSVPLPSGQVGP